ncbi:MAG TPA: L,D-transpeptidase family protein [Steroidobacteraceae bacterium]|nr:L,D-transpeptidase family protein [Steroidobacteraceae bacterium]
MFRKLLISIALGVLLAPHARADSLAGLAGPAGMLQPVDRVVVRKSTRRMELLRDGAVIASYKISLGLQPVGQKQREGDFRTPEGSYRLTRRNAQSDFFLAVQVSYPEASDIALARKNGWAPGGAIMVHGLPNILKYSRDRYLSTDWTDGCIALSNEDMLDFWLLTGADTRIEIRP